MSDERQSYQRKLKASEDRFRNIITHYADATVIVDRQGIVRFANPAAETLFDRPIDDLVGDMFGFPMVSGETTELGILRHGEAIAFAEMRVVDIEWEDEPAYLASLRDITERKFAIQLEHDRNRVLELIARARPLNETLASIVTLVEGQQSGLRCTVLLHQHQHNRLGVIAASKPPEHAHKQADGVPFHKEQCPCNQAMHTRTPVFVNDIASMPLCQSCFEAFKPRPIRSCWAFPLVSKDHDVPGLLVLSSQKASPPTDAERQLADVACHLAVIAIEQRRLTEKLTYQAHHDSLTGLPNRVLFEDHVQRELARAQTRRHMVAVFFIDLDGFKHINDTLGHPLGDLLLQQVAHRIHSMVGTQGMLARMGGDEFMLVCSAFQDPQTIEEIAQKVIDSLNEPFEVQDHELFVSASIGISRYPDDGDDVATLQRNADIAMYRAKDWGGHTFRCFDAEMKIRARERLEMETSLRRALEHDELLLFYQPQVDHERRLVGVEALVRWHHPHLGIVPPSSFIPLAEESGLILPIGTWVIQEACHQMYLWHEAGYPTLRVSVNVSPVQFAQADFVDVVEQTLSHYQRSNPYLELEITESMLIHDYPNIANKLFRLQELGVRIAVDDFGTGYSSLATLKRLPINTLKIDRSFVHTIGNGTQHAYNDMAIIGAITTLAYSLGLKVVAEGVETDVQFKFVRDVGCDGAQGNFFSPALPASVFEALLQRSRNGHSPATFTIPERYYEAVPEAGTGA